MNDVSRLLNSPDGRQWLAMQYVLAELPEVHRLEFELALEDNVALCEAVVEACRLSAGVALAFEAERMAIVPSGVSSVMVAKELPWTARFGVLVACASLLAMLVLISRAPLSSPIHETLASADDAAAADVLAGFLQDHSQPPLEGEVDLETDNDESLSDLMIPEWLLTAIDLDERDHTGNEDSANDGSSLF
jgi:hypothetical protein